MRKGDFLTIQKRQGRGWAIFTYILVYAVTGAIGALGLVALLYLAVFFKHLIF